MLVEHFLQLLAQEMNFTRGFISAEALQVLQHYAFPGNIRELKNIIEHALISSNGQPIQARHLHLIAITEAVPFQEVSAVNVDLPLTRANESAIAISANSTQDNEHVILKYLQQCQKINNIECQKLLTINHHQASYILKKMNKNKLLKREGERRWAFYCLP